MGVKDSELQLDTHQFKIADPLGSSVVPESIVLD